mgnify:FL=1
MKQYNKINNLVGWLAFVIAAFTYCSTIEPTASFWDCPEFITTGYNWKLVIPLAHLSSCLQQIFSVSLQVIRRK